MVPTTKMAVLSVAASMLACAALAQAPVPERPRSDGQRETLRHASAELALLHDALGNLVSDCSGGYVMVRACGPNPSRVGNACHEPLTTCETVDAFRATGVALEAVRRALEN